MDQESQMDESLIMEQQSILEQKDNDYDSLIDDSLSFSDAEENQQSQTIGFEDISKIPILRGQEIDISVYDTNGRIETQGFRYKKNQVEQIDLRDFQIQLFCDSVEVDDPGKKLDLNHSIIYLETGKGKTVISMMHIYYYLKKYKGDKKIIFLAETVQLVEQQCKQIRNQLYQVAIKCEESHDPRMMKIFSIHNCDRERFDIEDLRNQEFIDQFVIPVHAERDVESTEKATDLIYDVRRWTKERWTELIENSTVFVMIGQILLNAFRRGYLRLSDIALIVFDECHHAKHSHPYRQIIQEFYDDEKVTKHIQNSKDVKFLGLTASPVLGLSLKKIQGQQNPGLDSDKFKRDMYELCLNFYAKMVTIDSKLSNSTNIVKCYGEGSEDQTFLKQQQNFLLDYEELKDMYHEIWSIIQTQLIQRSFGVQVLVSLVEHHLSNIALSILFELGKYPYIQYLTNFLVGYNKEVDLFKKQRGVKSIEDESCLTKIQTILSININNLKNINGYENLGKPEINLSPKFNTLLNFLQQELKKAKINKLDEFEQSILAALEPKIIEEQEENFKKQLPMIIVFVQNKMTARYMDMVIKDLKTKKIAGYELFYSDYVQGVGRTSGQSQQVQILKRFTQKITSTIPQNGNLYLNEAIDLYESFKHKKSNIDDDEDIQKIEDDDLSNKEWKHKDLQEATTGYTKSGKLLQEIIFNLHKQQDIIQKFRQRKFNILISTSVTEEGFDIPECSMVIAFDKINSLKQYIQQKGRARGENSKFVIISNTKKIEIETRLTIYDRALTLIKKYALEAKQFNYSTMRAELKLIEETSQRQKLQGDGALRTNYYDRCIVMESLAIVNSNWAIEILANYANSVQGDREGFRNEYYIKGPLFYFVKYPSIGYACYIVLPKSAEKRYHSGDIKNTKDDAKRSAAYKAVVMLRKMKCLVADLRPMRQRLANLGSKQSLKEDLNDKEYCDQIEENMAVKKEFQKVEEGEPVLQSNQRYFKSLLQEAFEFEYTAKNFTNSEFRNSKDKLSFTILTFEFVYTKELKEKLPNTNQNQCIGMLHRLDHTMDNMSFQAEKSKSKILMNTEKDQIGLTYEEYEKLRQVSYFLESTSMNQDTYYYSCVANQEIKAGGKLDRKSKDNNHLYKFDNQKLNSILVILKKNQNFEYELDESFYVETQKYIKFMETTFVNLNNMKANLQMYNELQETKRELELNGKIEEAKNIKMHTWSRIYPHQQHQQMIKEYIPGEPEKLINTYIIQSLSDHLFMTKYVFQGYKPFEAQPDNHQTIKSEKDEWSFNAQTLTKNIKPFAAEFLGRSFRNPETSESYKFFQNEWAKFPLDKQRCFELRMMNDHILAQVRDYILACDFKHRVLIPMEQSALKHIQAKKDESYKISIVKNCLFEEEVEIFNYIQSKPEFANLKKRLISNLGDNQLIFGEKVEQPQRVFWTPCQVVSQIKDKLILQSLTSRQYRSFGNNLEVLEFLGDAVLKILGSIEVFVESEFVMEGELHVRRSRIVNNANLRQVAVKRQFYKYILVDRFEYKPPNFVFIRDTYDMQNEQTTEYMKRIFELFDKSLQEESEAMEKVNRVRKIEFQNKDLKQMPSNFKLIPEKTHADSFEALIGAYMQTFNSIDHCQFFLYSTKLLKYPTLKIQISKSYKSSIFDKDTLIMKNYKLVEQIIGYKFNNFDLLVQAFTHTSFLHILDRFKAHQKSCDGEFFENLNKRDVSSVREFFLIGKSISEKQENDDLINKLNEIEVSPFLSYERLEYMGDAVLDCVVVEWLVQNYKQDGPGDLSLRKQSIVCNKALSLVTIYYGLEKFILHNNLDVGKNRTLINKIKSDYQHYYNKVDDLYTDEPMIKILGDIFEALVGAIFLDSGFDYEVIKKVILGLLEKKFMKHFAEQSNGHFKQLQQLFRIKGYENVQPQLSEELPIGGENLYNFTDLDKDYVVNSVRALSEKEAIDKMLELIAKQQYQ